MKDLPENAVLLIIDVQKGFDDPYWGERNNLQAEANIARLLELWRRSLRPVVHIRHDSIEAGSPLRPGQSGNEFKHEVSPLPGEHLETKQVNSAFIGTGLERYLKEHAYQTLVIVGLTTDHCVSTSARMAGNLGFDTYVVSDACATFERTGPDGRVFTADDVHACALASLHNEFATVLTTAELLGALDCLSSAR